MTTKKTMRFSVAALLAVAVQMTASGAANSAGRS